MIWCTEVNSKVATPIDLSGFQDVTLQDIPIAAATDEEQTELLTLVE